MTIVEDMRTLTRRALAGESLVVDSDTRSLHELTQIAVALRPDANMAVRNAERLSPIEKASIETASKGRIVFV